ncbi:MAG: phosphate signaling complex protein PhoU [Gammaproteobacteria bacterium]
MAVQSENIYRQHTLQAFDGELNRLRSLVIEMAELVMYQLDQAMQALDNGDMSLALMVVERDKKVNQYEVRIDNEVVEVLARHCPVANDLRMLISISKVSYELEKIGDEVSLFAKLVSVLFDPHSSDPNPQLLEDIVKIGELVKVMLSKVLLALEKSDTTQAYLLLQYDRECESELQEGIKHQLAAVLRDIRLIGRAMDIMQIMKTLERCGEHSRNIAEYIIFMLEGVDIRHHRIGSSSGLI